MPTYCYNCPKCGEEFEEIRAIKAYCDDPTAYCSDCGHLCGKDDRDLSKTKLVFTGEKVTHAEYNPGLGMVVKSDHHKREILKQKNLVEIGNDFNSGSKMQETYDKRKKQEIESKWDKDPGDFFL